MGKKGKKSKRAAAGKNLDATTISVFLQNITSRVIKLTDESDALRKVGCLKQCIEKLNECIQIFESHHDKIMRHREKYPGRVLVLFQKKTSIFYRIILIEFSRCNYEAVIEIYNSMRERENFEKCFPRFRWVINIYHGLALIKLGAPCQLSPLVPTITKILHEATLSDKAKQDLPSFEILAAIDILRSAKDFDNAILLGNRLLDLNIDEANSSLAITSLEQYKAGKDPNSDAHFASFFTIHLKDLTGYSNTHRCMVLAQFHYLIHNETSESIYFIEMYLRDMFETGLNYCNTCSCVHTSEVQFVCSGCRSVCYCSRAHQRLTWMKDAVQGMRIGHKILCPLMKIYRKWRTAADNNEEKASRLRVKFEEACLRFLSHGLRLKDKRFE